MVSFPSPQGSQHKILIEQAIQQVTEETISHKVTRMRELLRGRDSVACITHIVCAKNKTKVMILKKWLAIEKRDVG